MPTMTRKHSPAEPKSKDAEDRDDGERRRDQIGDQLRKLYNDVAEEPVPDEFLKLLQDADKDPTAEAD